MSETPPTDQLTLRPIGVVRSPYKQRFGTPRQATVGDLGSGGSSEDGILALDPAIIPLDALRDLHGFDFLWVVTWFHLNNSWRATIRPPRGPKGVTRGLFATRSPHRPNPVGLSACQIVRIVGHEIHVHGLDMLDGTPILDVKPYVPYADAFPFARAGWVDEVDERDPSTGPGRRLIAP
jgi:tRNA-Thr(GGU) m(6)t(6)A37 methyltransferase TsaA